MVTDPQVCPLLSLSPDGRKGGQASSEDLFPLGYGEWERLGEGEVIRLWLCSAAKESA